MVPQFQENKKRDGNGVMGEHGRRKAPSTHPPPPAPTKCFVPYDDGGGWATATRGGLVGVGGARMDGGGLAPTLVAIQHYTIFITIKELIIFLDCN